MNQLDYSALSQPVTNTDIAAYKLWRNETPFFEQIFKVLLIVAIVMSAAMLLLSFFVVISGTEELPLSSLLSGIIAVIMIFAGRAAYRNSIIRRARLHKFAQSNHIELILEKPVPSDQYGGLIFDEGDSRRINEAFRLPGNIEIGNYEYITGSGKNQSEHIWGYVKIKLARRLPQMVLDARSNNIMSISNLPDKFRGQEMVLEGNFNKYFTLYAPKEYDVDARYVFSPDVMAALIDYGSKYDMEVVDDQLYMYSKDAFRLYDVPTLQQLLKVVGVIGTELIDQSQNYSDDRVGDSRANIIAEPGRKLKQRYRIHGISFAIGVLLYIAIYVLGAANRQ